MTVITSHQAVVLNDDIHIIPPGMVQLPLLSAGLIESISC